MKSAHFFKNVENIEDLEKKTKQAFYNKAQAQRYVVIKRYIMKHNDFLEFSRSFMCTQKFINEISHMLILNEKCEYVCVSLTSKQANYEILVNSSGYSYARIVAMIEKGNENGL